MDDVHAVIELKITPQRDSGFGRIAERVAKFEPNRSCKFNTNSFFMIFCWFTQIF